MEKPVSWELWNLILDPLTFCVFFPDLFSRMVNESDVMENIDAPEAGLDALMQVCLAFLKGQ
jgi:hypothetical protein